jgi:hypothetical protein
MDVGLNNRNMFTDDLLGDVDFLVEATSFERYTLWKEHHKDFGWIQHNQILDREIKKIKGRPISINFAFATIKNKKVAFYHPSSTLVDYKVIKKWLTDRFQLTHDNYTRWNHVDANNFHNCLNSLDNLDKNPRNTKYKERQY